LSDVIAFLTNYGQQLSKIDFNCIGYDDVIALVATSN